MSNFESLVATFPNPLGLGSRFSLYMIIFVEVFCSVGVIFGAFYRLALIPMIFSMCVAFVVVHRGQPFAAKELAFIYLVVFVAGFLLKVRLVHRFRSPTGEDHSQGGCHFSLFGAVVYHCHEWSRGNVEVAFVQILPVG